MPAYGRKIIVDTMRGGGRMAAGRFSGKDPTKVDRSAAYAAAILRRMSSRRPRERDDPGRLWHRNAEAALVYVETDGTGKVDEDKLSRVLQELMDLSPRGSAPISAHKPIYAAPPPMAISAARRSRWRVFVGAGSTLSTSCRSAF